MTGWQYPEQWSEWNEYLAAGLHGRCRWRLAILIGGLLFATGRRTVSSWLRAAGIARHFSSYYYLLPALGRRTAAVARRLLILLVETLPWCDPYVFALDDTPSKRYGPKVQGAGIHHNPHSGPGEADFLYGHIWVTVAWVVRHLRWGAIGLPLRALLYIRQQDLPKLPRRLGWTFRTKLELAGELVAWVAEILGHTGKAIWFVVDGAYANRPFLSAARKAGVVVISRLARNAGLRTLPPRPKKGQRRKCGQPRKYGAGKISLLKRAAHPGGWKTIPCRLYHRRVTKRYKDFVAAWPVAHGAIHVVIVRERLGPQFFFATDPTLSVREILKAAADRFAIEQDFHDLKEVGGASQAQVRTVWANLGVWHLHLWLHSLVELWAWKRPQEQLCDRRQSPWDDPQRRPSHADRCKALRRFILESEYSASSCVAVLPQKIRRFVEHLIRNAA
jgi:hypothetical protein